MSNKTFTINEGDFIYACEFSKEQQERFCQLANSINNGYHTGEWMRWYGEIDYLGVENNRIHWGDCITSDRKDITSKFKHYLQEEDMNIKCIPEQGDYVSVKDMKEYAISKGKTLQQVYASVYDKFIQAGAMKGEGLRYAKSFTSDDEAYGWSKTSEGMFFFTEGEPYASTRFTNRISVTALLEGKETEILDWNNMPPVGTKVRFIRYDNGHTHWRYEAGEVYTIEEDGSGDIGPFVNGCTPSRNWSNSFVFEILQEENMSNNFSKKDLKDGMVLTLRKGELRYVLKGSTWDVNGNTFTKGANLTDYREDLLINVHPLGGRNSDIVKVIDRDGKVLYVRQEEPVEFTLEQVAEKFGLDVGQIRIKK